VGIVNVAGDGVITLRQATRLLGRASVPVPLSASGLLGRFIKHAGLADFSWDQMQHLAWGRVLDTTKMRQALRLEPEFTTRTAFDDFASHLGSCLPGSATIGATVAAVNGLAGTVATCLTNTKDPRGNGR
jgi:UDP-glucose 4-epimerase